MKTERAFCVGHARVRGHTLSRVFVCNMGAISERPAMTCFLSPARRAGIPVFLMLCFVPFLRGQASSDQTADEHQPLVSEKINELAHRLLAAGLRSNALAGDDLKPWHIKITYQILVPGNPKPVSGTVEEWHASANQWRRTFTGDAPGLRGSEWSISELGHYETKDERLAYGRRLVTLRIARPVVDPLYQAANIKPDYDLDVRKVETAGIILHCVSVVDPKRYAEDTNPDWLFPTMCFDNDTRLRVTVAGDTSVQFEGIQSFQERSVPRDVKVLVNGNLNAEMKVTLLENWDARDTGILKPSKGAIPKPYEIEPGHRMPESVYEVGAHVPLRPDGFPYRGAAVVSVLIQKDGNVKVEQDYSFGPSRAVLDSIALAVSQWKYKPYIVDGQPVEVRRAVVYRLDGEPFVPSYERKKTMPAIAASPEDYWSSYDPKRDPEKDLTMAEIAATKAHKRILVEVGGDWCIWCRYLDKFFDDHADAREQRDANYVVLKVNMSPQNENSAFLSRFPKIPAYPYFFVLDSDGKMLTAKKSGELEECCKTYNSSKIKAFLADWKVR